MTMSRLSAEAAVKQALSSHPDASAADIAAAAGLGRSTAAKMLARLESAGEASRSPGGRSGARQRPDRWALAKTKAKATGQGAQGPAAAGRRKARARQAASTRLKRSSAGDRLRPGQLDDLVLGYLKQHAASGPHGPTTVARALERSSGAVVNCLARLATAKQVRQVSDKPRRYCLAA